MKAAARRILLRALAAWVALFALTLAIVGAIGALFGDRIQAWDEAMLARMLDGRAPELMAFSHAITDLGKPAATAPLTTLAVLAFWQVRLRRDALWVLMSTLGAGAAYLALLPIFGRARPDTYDVSGLALPSGHAAATLGLALPVAIASFRAWRWKSLPIVIVCAVSSALVGVTRPYIQFHYVTDVLVGWVMTAAWVFALDRWVLPPPQNLRRPEPSNGP